MAYHIHVASKVAGLSLRKVRYWDQLGLVKPSVQAARGRGSRRLYSFDDLVELRVIAHLRESGISLQKIRKVVQYVHRSLASGSVQPRSTRMLTDGHTVFVRSDEKERWADALRGGQVVWFVPVGVAWQETDAEVKSLSEPRIERVRVAGRDFRVTFEADLEVGGWVVECPALPGCVSEGDTVPSARRMIKDAIGGWLTVATESTRAPARKGHARR